MKTDLDQLVRLAIKAALNQEWSQAVDLNLHILQLKSNDIPTLNRLAKAYEKTGEPEKAKKAYQKVLKLDRFNSIAGNNITRIQTTKIIEHPEGNGDGKPFSFIEEPGTTRSTYLTKLAPRQVIDSLDISGRVILKPYRRSVGVFTQENVCIGSLPDDLSQYLLKLIKMGNKYEAAIKTITKSQIEVFIREIHKSKRLKGLPSFPLRDTKSYYALLPTDPISEVPLEFPEHEDGEI